MMARLFSSFVLGSITAGHPVDCNITDDLFGQMQVWVPDCHGAGCLANGIDQECAWHVHDMDRCRSVYGDDCDATDAARKAQQVSGIPVSSGNYNVDGYACSGTKTDIWFPSTGGPYPLVIYLHGSGGGDDGRSSQFASVASTGLVVIAPITGGYPGGGCSSKTEWEDAVTAWTSSKSGGSSLSPGLAKVDWSKTGIWGYSMGGKTTPEASIQQPIGASAVVCSHDARNSSVLGVPALYITGTNDDMSSPPAVLLEQFDEDTDNQKIFANLQGGEHTWPITRGTMNPWIAKFFGCELSGKTSDCDSVYGTGSGSLCASNDFAQCKVVQPSVAV